MLIYHWALVVRFLLNLITLRPTVLAVHLCICRKVIPNTRLLVLLTVNKSCHCTALPHCSAIRLGFQESRPAPLPTYCYSRATADSDPVSASILTILFAIPDFLKRKSTPSPDSITITQHIRIYIEYLMIALWMCAVVTMLLDKGEDINLPSKTRPTIAWGFVAAIAMIEL